MVTFYWQFNSVYDEALYYTNKEMKAKGKGDIDVQSVVERPQVYILGRCGSSEVDQLAYINTRKACLQSMNIKITTSNGVEITDVMRFFHGDGPEQQFEAGEQKGEMLDVQVAVVMQQSTKTLQFLFPNLTLLSQNG